MKFVNVNIYYSFLRRLAIIEAVIELLRLKSSYSIFVLRDVGFNLIFYFPAFEIRVEDPHLKFHLSRLE